ncbi:AMP-binding protein, partial [Collimonas pratensis]|uniref:AMP-binding protein n=1 Tax=Collimonas pratensis TaxID=279113 RepID=UPI001F0FA4D0
MLEDTAATLLLTQVQLRNRFPDYQGETICLDENWANIVQMPDINPINRTLPQHLAYCIYTSGSTGRPKGVLITASSLARSTLARTQIYVSVGRFLLLSSVAFDSSVAGVFGTLTNQGTLVIASRKVTQDPSRLIEMIEEQHINTMLCVPSLYATLLANWPDRHRTVLEKIIVAGEPCSPVLLNNSLTSFTRSKLFNEYGPTENTVWATVYACTDPFAVTVPIGRPIANTQIYILDNTFNPAPVGVSGEVYIAGSGL